MSGLVFIRTVPNVMEVFGCSSETAQRYIDLRDEGYGMESAKLMAGLSDPPEPQDNEEAAPLLPVGSPLSLEQMGPNSGTDTVYLGSSTLSGTVQTALPFDLGYVYAYLKAALLSVEPEGLTDPQAAYFMAWFAALPDGVMVPLKQTCPVHGHGRIDPPALVSPGAAGCTCGVTGGALLTAPWVSVDERLPESTGYVLMAASSGLVTSTLFCEDVGYFRKETPPDVHSWKFRHGAKYGYTVTHWMPLPAPPMNGADNASPRSDEKEGAA